MRIPKQYGQSKIENCPFCGNRATTTNNQDVPVCQKHKDKDMVDLKCICGEWLDIKKGKYGPYFFCMQCGNISFSKAIEVNPQVMEQDKEDDNKFKSENKVNTEKPSEKSYDIKERKEIFVSSDDVDFI